MEYAAKVREGYARLRGTAEHPRVSVVLPVHIKEPLPRLYRNFSSLFENTEAPATEIVAVLNGKATMAELEASLLHQFCSQVNVRLFCISYLDDPRYVQIQRPQNIFVPKQYGLDMALGDIVLHTDVDCYYSKNWISSYVKMFEADARILAAYGPVFYDSEACGIISRGMTALSTLSKAAKILFNFPPLAGHNHAVRRQVRELAPMLYGDLSNNCQIITSRLMQSLTTESALRDVVTFVPGALVSTLFPKRTDNVLHAIAWILEAGLRNVSNYKLHRDNLADKASDK
ncbi:glycosyltransferase [Megalodesulfovibrio paquesii]